MYSEVINACCFAVNLLTADRAGVERDGVLVDVLLARINAVNFLVAGLAVEWRFVVHVDDFMQLQFFFSWEFSLAA